MVTRRISGRSLSFLEAGDPAATRVLVLAHAFPVGVRIFEPQLDACRAGACPGWRVIAPALPGFDGSDLLDEVSIDAYARHVLSLLDELGIDRAVFGGVSMGGYLAFAVVRQAAERVAGLLLANTRSAPDTAVEGRRRMLQTVEESGAGPIADAMVPKLLGNTTHQRRPDIVARVRTMILGQSVEGIGAAIRVLMSRPDSTPLLGGLRVPVLVIAGEEDVLTPAAEMEGMAAAIPHATFVQIAGAGHLSNLESPEAFNAAVNTFLGRGGRL